MEPYPRVLTPGGAAPTQNGETKPREPADHAEICRDRHDYFRRDIGEIADDACQQTGEPCTQIGENNRFYDHYALPNPYVNVCFYFER